jgi:hypothetical protein
MRPTCTHMPPCALRATISGLSGVRSGWLCRYAWRC